MGYGRWAPYVPVAKRRAKAEKEMAKLRKKGHPVAPVIIEGRTIARTFWGKAWCDNLESYHDYENRLPRGRTYVRNGSVVDLQIAPGEVKAIVSGTSLYTVAVTIKPLAAARWQSICRDCAGAIDSLVELLQGRFSKGVMERLCRQDDGLFPKPAEIRFSCSCPDWASMCKHIAAVFYGIGARLDAQPELLFRLRDVDEKGLVADLDRALPVAKTAPAADRLLADNDLSALFGLNLAVPDVTAVPGPEASTPGAESRLRRQPGRQRVEASVVAAEGTTTPVATEKQDTGSTRLLKRGKTAKVALHDPGPPKAIARSRKKSEHPAPPTSDPPEPTYELTPDGFVKWWK